LASAGSLKNKAVGKVNKVQQIGFTDTDWLIDGIHVIPSKFKTSVLVQNLRFDQILKEILYINKILMVH
jgi:hypothetical protein